MCIPVWSEILVAVCTPVTPYHLNISGNISVLDLPSL